MSGWGKLLASAQLVRPPRWLLGSRFLPFTRAWDYLHTANRFPLIVVLGEFRRYALQGTFALTGVSASKLPVSRPPRYEVDDSPLWVHASPPAFAHRCCALGKSIKRFRCDRRCVNFRNVEGYLDDFQMTGVWSRRTRLASGAHR
ncbi:uncharacterized protein EI90DRAFT_492231 [Cantharellus anzutake]|uniref:uncharacterized protein n=1 Tax=Cantharellus anzutake TaxID=1750568 RepID=UPI001908016A|nr:uncharacterized protein EI90DRAFT_492231 [Cantharellus anzutake]KAF8333966.1 hypothetical protein EI90DRAFT_492231 [Cantharellus anzutake]